MSKLRYPLAILVLGLMPCVLGAQGKVVATIDATKTGAPIPKLSYGGFMEPATTSVWRRCCPTASLPTRWPRVQPKQLRNLPVRWEAAEGIHGGPSAVRPRSSWIHRTPTWATRLRSSRQQAPPPPASLRMAWPCAAGRVTPGGSSSAAIRARQSKSAWCGTQSRRP